MRRQIANNVSAQDKLICVERELQRRYRIYPQLVAYGSMTVAQMKHEIAVMEQIATDLRKATEKEIA